jgi:hypothetical protein
LAAFSGIFNHHSHHHHQQPTTTAINYTNPEKETKDQLKIFSAKKIIIIIVVFSRKIDNKARSQKPKTKKKKNPFLFLG